METPALKAQRLLEQLHRQRQNEVDKVPPGYMTIKQYGKLWKMGRSNTERLLKKAVKNKMVKVVRLRQVVEGRITILSFYG